jgi:hypothetical protein
MLPSSIDSSGSLTNNPALAPFANVPCLCQRYFVGGEHAWDHMNSCLHHASNGTCAHDHVLRALERICHCHDAGFATTHKRVLTSEGNDLEIEIRNIHVAQQTDLLVDVTVGHNFIGAGHIGQTQGHLRNPDNPDHILESAADKIRNSRDTFRRNRHVAFLPACMSTSGRIHGEL